MTVHIHYKKSILSKSPFNSILFVDEKFDILNLKRQLSSREYSFIHDILKIKVPVFPIDGEFLKQKGMQEGQTLGNVLKLLENEWIKNNFKISKEKIDEVIQTNLN